MTNPPVVTPLAGFSVAFTCFRLPSWLLATRFLDAAHHDTLTATSKFGIPNELGNYTGCVADSTRCFEKFWHLPDELREKAASSHHGLDWRGGRARAADWT